MELKLRECIETIMTRPFYVHQTSLIVSDGKMDSVYVTVYSKLSPWNRWNSVKTRVLFPIEAQKICGLLVVTNSTQCYIYLER